jgi:hypothetical protein
MRRIQVAACPTCGQPLRPLLLGIRWRRIKSAIIETLIAAGDLGTTTDKIIGSVYDGMHRPAPSTIRAHIRQINDMLETEAPQWVITHVAGHWALQRRA